LLTFTLLSQRALSHCHHQRLALRLTEAYLRTVFTTLTFTHYLTTTYHRIALTMFWSTSMAHFTFAKLRIAFMTSMSRRIAEYLTQFTSTSP
jgi:hypothetical protein